MDVLKFDTFNGLYVFHLEELYADFHSHPATEIITASEGSFTFSTTQHTFHNVTFAVVDRNVAHQISIGEGSKVAMVMIEHHDVMVVSYLANQGIHLSNGHYCNTLESPLVLVEDIVNMVANAQTIQQYDGRVLAAINYMVNNQLEYKTLMDSITQEVGLSESRISHLFKENVGISLKRYLIWTKLKHTIQHHLNREDDLMTSLFKAGFYDQPHFIKNFKAMLGVSPARAYNSRTLQS